MMCAPAMHQRAKSPQLKSPLARHNLPQNREPAGRTGLVVSPRFEALRPVERRPCLWSR